MIKPVPKQSSRMSENGSPTRLRLAGSQDERPHGHRWTGAGETAIAAAPGAIANAVRAATGIRPRRFPLRPADFALA